MWVHLVKTYSTRHIRCKSKQLFALTERCTCGLSKMAARINKKYRQARKRLPRAIYYWTNQLRGANLRQNYQKLLNDTLQSVETKATVRLSQILLLRPSLSEAETVFRILVNIRDVLQAHIDVLLKELQQQLIQLQGHVSYLTTSSGSKSEAKNEKGIVDALTKNIYFSTFAAFARTGVNSRVAEQRAANLSSECEEVGSTNKCSQIQGGNMDGIPEAESNTADTTNTLEHQDDKATNAQSEDSGCDQQTEGAKENQEVYAKSYAAAIQRLLTEKLEQDLQGSVLKHIEKLNLLRKEASELGVEIHHAFTKCEAELQELPSVCTKRTKQMLQDVAARTLTPLADVGTKFKECLTSVSELTNEIRGSFEGTHSYLKLAALSIQMATEVARFPISLARIYKRMAISAIMLPSQASKIILASPQDADSRASEILTKLTEQLQTSKGSSEG